MKVFLKNFWSKLYRKRSIFFTWIIIVAVFLAFFGSNTYTIITLENKKNDLSRQFVSEQERAASLDAQLESVGTREYIERVARERYKLYYPDEMIVTTVYENEETEK